MAHYVTTEQTDWDPEGAFAYLADFSSVADWDPSIEWCRLVDGEPRSVGARYELELETLGRRTRMTYVTIAVEAPLEVVLRSETGALVSLDTMTFEPRPDGGTAVTYDADLKLKGPLRLLDPVLGLAFGRIGDRAAAGLRERLAGPLPERVAP